MQSRPNHPATASPRAGDVVLHTEVCGEGPPVVLLHGFGASTYTWRHLVGPLSEGRRVIALDLKGFGASPKPRDGAYSVHDQAALVRRYVAENDLRDVTLVGHSFGGAVALVTALGLVEEEPERLAGLVLIGAASMTQNTPKFIRLLQAPVLGPMGVHLVPERYVVKRTLELGYYRPERITEEQIEAYAGPMGCPGAKQALLETARALPPPDQDALVARFGSIRVPVLLLWGRHDKIVPLEVGERLHAVLPDSELVVIEEAGHIPQEERPAETVGVIEGFLSERRL